MYFLSLTGLTVGFHRLYTHRSFKANRYLGYVLAIFGSMSAQGPVIFWVATHRRHHIHSDKEHDPHSPIFGEKVGFWGNLKKIWHSHIGWQFSNDLPNTSKYARDLLKDPTLLKINKRYLYWVYLGLLIPGLFGYIATQTIEGTLLAFLWGGLIRIFLVSHAVYSLNSLCHLFGVNKFRTGEGSRNNWWLAIPTLGEGWHNNHHAFPNAASLRFKWWQIDISAIIIWFLRKLGLVEKIFKPSKRQINNKLK